VLGPETEGMKIETIEGLAKGDQLHPLQKKFVEMAALQCGICTPGFLIASKALLEKTPNPTETEVRYWLAGNLCRCTGYDKIVTAVLEVAADMRESARCATPPTPPASTSGSARVPIVPTGPTR
ncbi:MAG TPA: 2Fe-2S iron-sulfur cluster-binding protein, partial [Reyranella sp.]|nr:2Fe-2S iron-sulfur cluster-binding protein [Reyranella sp.]